MNKKLILGAIVLSFAATACDNPEVEALGTNHNKQEYTSAVARKLHFELQGNTLTAPRYQYMIKYKSK